ncbi:MAG TPA: outer membrane beta-barrel protein, partial [Bacteroidales bacterium]|nr:outer membrane beta-barrel protein [Bacteroidales bacterium]
HKNNLEVIMKSRIILAAICIFFLTTSISFGYNLTFTPRLSVKGEYTDNVLLSEKDSAIQDDYITTINPGFTAELIGKKGDATISYDPSYAFYDQFDEFNGWRHSARFNGFYEMTKHTRLDARDNFLYTEDPIRYDNLAEVRTEDPTLPIDTSERKTRRVYTRNYASVGLNHQFGEYHSFSLGYSHNILSNDDPAYEDKQNHNASAGLTYWFGPKWGFDVNGSYKRGEFEVSDNVNEYQGSLSLLKRFGKHFTGHIRYSHLVVNYDGESGDDTTYIPTIGFKYDIEKDISLIADAGYFYTDSELRENTSNAIGDLRLIKRFEHGKLNLALLGGYDYDLYGAETNGYGEYYEVSISLSHQLAKHVHGNIFGSYRDTKYKDQSDREDKRPTAGLRLTWRALEWMDIGLNYRFRSVDSTIDTNDYDENRVSVKITVFPTVPFHTSRY